jgi:DNA polymerase III subunit gamma/tau
MGYQVLARKYRPQYFADVAGQDHVTCTLMNALGKNRVAHGYIFSGHRGIGKTTIARILAMALNCRTDVGAAERPTAEPCGACDSCVEIRQGNSVDVIEIDAATNRGIDEIRELRDAARYSPARDRYKIYILDEAHQITEAAFNALLKTLEEPPAHVIFMMATTEPENIPQTIRSRCQHFSFHAVKFDAILAQLKVIAAAEQVGAEEDALALLAEAGDGSMRDALSIMDQAIASAPVENGRPVLSAAQIRELMGSVPNTVFERVLEAVAAGQSAALMEQVNELVNAGHSPSSLARQMVRYMRNALMAKLGGEHTELLQISADERARAARTALLFTEEEITRNLQIVLRTFDDLNYRQEQRFHLELGLLKLIHAQRLLPVEELLSSIAGGGGRGTALTSDLRRTTATAAAPRTSMAARPVTPAISPFEKPEASGGGIGRKQSAVGIDQFPTALAAIASRDARAETTSEKTPGPAPDPSSGSEEASQRGSRTAAGEAAGGDAEVVGVDVLRTAVVAALAGAGHDSAAHVLGAGAWALEGSGLRIEVAGMGKKMLGLTVNAAAERIIRQELGRLEAPTRFVVVPGAEAGPSTKASPDVAPAASGIQQAALGHPLVEKARAIFNAEVRSVVDLRETRPASK